MVTRSQARRRAQYIETDNTGTQIFSTIVLPAEIKDPEALAYDASHDVFYVGGGFSPDIWVVDHSGNILQKLDVLEGYRHETHKRRSTSRTSSWRRAATPTTIPPR